MATTGCADGEREALFDSPSVAGCATSWDNPASLRAPLFDIPCGDDLRTCTAPGEACAPGWHVCGSDGSVGRSRARRALPRSGASSPRSITDAIAVCVCTIGRADLYHEPRRQLVQPVCCGGELLPRSTPRAPDAIGFTLDEVLEPNAADDGASSSLCCARSIRLTGTCNLHLHVYQFRHLVEADRSLIARWRAAQHVREWWGAPSVEEEGEKLLDPRIAMWIVELDGRPFAFAQDYDVHGWHPHPFSYLPPRSRGIDQYIGEVDMLDQGHGSRFVRQHVERLFAAGAPAVGTDPHPSNARARRAYEKAGFAVTSEPVDTPWGRAILMECWPT